METKKHPISPPTTAEIATAPPPPKVPQNQAAATPAKKSAKPTPAFPGPSAAAKALNNANENTIPSN